MTNIQEADTPLKETAISYRSQICTEAWVGAESRGCWQIHRPSRMQHGIVACATKMFVSCTLRRELQWRVAFSAGYVGLITPDKFFCKCKQCELERGLEADGLLKTTLTGHLRLALRPACKTSRMCECASSCTCRVPDEERGCSLPADVLASKSRASSCRPVQHIFSSVSARVTKVAHASFTIKKSSRCVCGKYTCGTHSLQEWTERNVNIDHLP